MRVKCRGKEDPAARKMRLTFKEVLREDQGGKCAYCLIGLRENGGQIDRIIPGHEYSIPNCVLACGECNMHKKNNDVNDFLDDMQSQGIISEYWVMPGGRYHRPAGGEFEPNPDYQGELSQCMPETQKE